MVREVVVDHLKLAIDRDQVQPDTPLFGTGLGLDSVDAVDLVMGVEARTNLRIPDTWEGRAALRSVNQLIGFLMEHDADVVAG